MNGVLQQDSLKMVAKAGAIKNVRIVGQGDSFALVITLNSGENMALVTTRGDLRRFKKLETILTYLKDDCGVGEATLKFDTWTKEQSALAL